MVVKEPLVLSKPAREGAGGHGTDPFAGKGSRENEGAAFLAPLCLSFSSEEK